MSTARRAWPRRRRRAEADYSDHGPAPVDPVRHRSGQQAEGEVRNYLHRADSRSSQRRSGQAQDEQRQRDQGDGATGNGHAARASQNSRNAESRTRLSPMAAAFRFQEPLSIRLGCQGEERPRVWRPQARPVA